MSRPILLWNRKSCTTSDEAGTTVIKSVLPSAPPPGPYERSPSADPSDYVPSLLYFCVRRLLEFPDQIHALGGPRIPYELPKDAQSFDILRAFIPSYRPHALPDEDYAWSDFNTRMIDPRLWATIVQIFSNLPALLYRYSTALSDKHLPLLQCIPSTPNFSLVTVLNLSKCLNLTDETILQLKALHSLSALDVSDTVLTTHGIGRLASTLCWTDNDAGAPGERRGPWGLRMLWLLRCVAIEDDVIPHLARFPLLSVIDLRGTRVSFHGLKAATGFRSCSYPTLFHPTPVCESLDDLSTISALSDHSSASSAMDATPVPISTLFSSPLRPFIVSVDTLHHPESYHLFKDRKTSVVNRDDTFVVLRAAKVPTSKAAGREPVGTFGPYSRSQSTSNINTVQVGFTNNIWPRDESRPIGPFHIPRPRDTSMVYGGYDDLCSTFGGSDSEGSSQNSDSDIDEFDDLPRAGAIARAVALQNEAAARIVRTHAARRTAEAFYASARPTETGRPTHMVDPLPARAPPAIGARLPPKGTGPPQPYVLYRHPPPWARLDELARERVSASDAHTKAGGKRPAPSQLGMAAEHGSARALEDVRGLMAAIGKRRKVNTSAAGASEPRVACAGSGGKSGVSKNPFLRRSEPMCKEGTPTSDPAPPEASTASVSRSSTPNVRPSALQRQPEATLDPLLARNSMAPLDGLSKKRPRLSMGAPPTCSQAFSSFQPFPKNTALPHPPPDLKVIAGRVPISNDTIPSSSKIPLPSSRYNARAKPTSLKPMATAVHRPAPRHPHSFDAAPKPPVVKLKAIGGRMPILDDALPSSSKTPLPSSRTSAPAKPSSFKPATPHARSSGSERTSSPDPAPEKSTLTPPRPARSNKPLVPISSLPVPPLPESALRALKQTAAKAKAAQALPKAKVANQSHLRLTESSFGHSGVKGKGRTSMAQPPRLVERTNEVGGKEVTVIGTKSGKRVSDAGMPTQSKGPVSSSKDKDKACRKSMPFS